MKMALSSVLLVCCLLVLTFDIGPVRCRRLFQDEDPCAKCNRSEDQNGCKCDDNCDCVGGGSNPPVDSPCAKCDLSKEDGGCKCNDNCDCIDGEPTPQGNGGVFLSFTGGYPGGLSPVDLSQVPGNPGLKTQFLALAFAWDRNPEDSSSVSNGNFDWYTAIKGAAEYDYSPTSIGNWKAQAGNRQVLISLAGDRLVWQDPSDANSWVNNAASSLTNMMSSYSADGIEVNYENGVDSPTFRNCMCGLFAKLKEAGKTVIIDFFGGVQAAYGQLYNQCPDVIDYITWQSYFLETAPLSDVVSNMEAAMGNNFGGAWSKLLVGFSSAPRGLCQSDLLQCSGGSIFTGSSVMVDLVAAAKAKGSPGAWVWTLENSGQTSPGYQLETTLMNAVVA